MRSGLLVSLALSSLFALSCSRRPAGSPIERLAILRFENTGTDTSRDWIGRALSEILTASLSASPGIYAIPASRIHSFDRALGARPISAPGISTERTAALAAGANEIGYGDYGIRSGRLEVRLTLEDPRTGMTSRVVSASAPANDVVAAATDLAHQVTGHAAPYGTKDARALEAWATALESRDAAAATQNLEQAIAADPDFGPPYRMLAERMAQSGNRDRALSLLETALSRGDRIPEVERAHLEFEAASLRGDEVSKERALLKLVKLDPTDAIAWRGLAAQAMARRDYNSAVQAFRKVLEIEPEDVAVWNQLGYAAAYSGDPNTAMNALRRYQTARPADANPLDSMGDVQILAGKLREAEDLYLQAARKDPAFPATAEMFKAAMARLMSGDVAGADALSKQFSDAREAAHDPLVETYRAEWLWISGRRKEGVERLTAFAQAGENGPLREASSRCYAELALWNLMLGDRAAAADLARKAVALAGPSSNALAAVSQFLAQPPASASEWAGRIEQLFPNSPTNPVRGFALAYALLAGRDFPAASLVLKQIYDHNGEAADASVSILLAWTYLETGRIQQVEPLLRWNPIPPLTGPGALLSFHFPRIYYLRGLAAEKAGKTEEARTNYRLFLTLSGPDPLMWGEEKKAQAGL